TVDNVCAIVVMLHDYRFGLKALLSGGYKNDEEEEDGDIDEDGDGDEFDGRPYLYFYLLIIAPSATPLYPVMYNSSASADDDGDEGCGYFCRQQQQPSPQCTYPPSLTDVRFGNTLEQFTAQLPQLPDDKKCMVLWAAGDSQLVASVLQHYGTDKLSWVHSLSAGVDNLVPALVSNNLADKSNEDGGGLWTVHVAADDGRYSLMCMLHFNKKMPVVRGKTVGFVGFGSIAQETAKVCRPLGMKILALRNRPDGPGSDLADEVLNAGVPEEKNK
ncbi:hypothetical protein FOZ63_008324, partial [Perkinsus olseni]